MEVQNVKNSHNAKEELYLIPLKVKPCIVTLVKPVAYRFELMSTVEALSG
jgi:hypothetical protein